MNDFDGWHPIKALAKGFRVDIWVVSPSGFGERFPDMILSHDGEWIGPRRFLHGDKATHWRVQPPPPKEGE